MAKGNERNDRVGGIGAGGPQRGPIGGDDEHQQQETDIAATGGIAEGDLGQGGQRREGGSSADSENQS